MILGRNSRTTHLIILQTHRTFSYIDPKPLSDYLGVDTGYVDNGRQ